MQGEGFRHPNVCALTVRYGALNVAPNPANDTWMTSSSPKVSLPGAVTLTLSGNGQNFNADKILHRRDEENTFWYYQYIHVEDIKPALGPSTGGTKILVEGRGFRQFTHPNGTVRDVPLFMRFTDFNGSPLGAPIEAQRVTHTDFVLRTPPGPPNSKA